MVATSENVRITVIGASRLNHSFADTLWIGHHENPFTVGIESAKRVCGGLENVLTATVYDEGMNPIGAIR